MKKQETTLYLLSKFIPQGTFKLVAPYFRNHIIHLTLTRERKSVLGDYRNPSKDYPYHRISVNVNLNPYSFLITLLHELAHMMVYVHFQNTVAPHGKEWKTQFRHILIPFIGKKFFPVDVEKALLAYLHNPAASTCSDQNLYKALYQYDEYKAGYKLVEDISIGGLFEVEGGKMYQKLEQLRTRCKCKELGTNKVYLFQNIVEVKAVRRSRKTA